MEFYTKLESHRDASLIQRDITIASLSDHCASIDQVLHADGDHGTIYCLWGEFEIRREVIQHGVRFTLPKCPNALAWTITHEPVDDTPLLIHCTINRHEHDPDFIESIEQFMQDWAIGLAT